MEQTLGWRELCVQTLPTGLRLVNSLIEYIPAEVILGFAAFGALCLPVVVFQFGSCVVQGFKKLLRSRASTTSVTAIATVPRAAPRGELSAAIAASSSTAAPEASSSSAKTSAAPPGTSEGSQLVGIYTFFKPGPPTLPATPRHRVLRSRGRSREASLPAGVAP